MASQQRRSSRISVQDETRLSAAVNEMLDELDPNDSDMDLTDDEDADPTFSIEREQTPGEDIDSSSSSSSENDEEDSRDETERPRIWVKRTDFEPLPPAPEFNEVPTDPIDFSPDHYFTKYIPNDFYTKVSEYTNQKYLAEKGKVLNTTPDEIKNFIAISITMSYLKFPRIRMYWAKKTRIHSIASTMTRDRYFAIRGHLKLVNDDNVPVSEKVANKFWKVQPLISMVKTACRLNDRSTAVSIDEQMIPFWGHSSARQFVRNKPNPCGLKNFVATSPDGLPLDFILYQGKGDFENGYPGLDLGGKVVMKLTETLPSGITIYMDRYFTSIGLLDALHSEAECQGTGTIQKNRIPPNTKLKDDLEMKKLPRGTVDQSVRGDGQICIVKWFDNKPVLLVSSKEGMNPLDECRRYSKAEGEHIQVPRPLIVKSYNENMGGVDFLDRVISYYRIMARTRKWTVRLIFHFIDFALAAGWIEYRRAQFALRKPRRLILDYLEFREHIDEFLRHTTDSDASDSDYDGPSPAKHHRALQPLPSDALRKSKREMHMPEFPNPAKKNRCRLPGCNANTARIRCSKCQVFLCLQEQRNCFKLFHEMV
ncbi:hypothetical protein M8J76_004584 [Diaphorina citri]|nr:hypothetical protein M8J75_001787 [Diaphorina citri]KAI5744713.1 hypothetical protein M8J76_004584 [Diaphorina citri]